MRGMRPWLLLLLLLPAAAARPVSLAEVEADPKAHFGRELAMLGYLWPWSRPTPLPCRGLPLARGNLARTRSDPNFCDGTRIAFAKVEPKGPLPEGAVWVRARVEPGPRGWYLVVTGFIGRAPAPPGPPPGR